MGSSESGSERALELEAGEEVRWSTPGLYLIGRTWIGGRIYVSDRRLLFCPGVLVRRRYGVLRVPLAEVAHVDRLERKVALGAIADGGLKPRLRITTHTGDVHMLTPQRFGKHVEELQSLLSGDPRRER
jgi:hypothetical protein